MPRGSLAAGIEYSEKYMDEQYEYRHVILPRELARELPKRILSETEWREAGVQQSRGWAHYVSLELPCRARLKCRSGRTRVPSLSTLALFVRAVPGPSLTFAPPPHEIFM